MSKLPSNWQVKSLGDICNITTGNKDVNEGDSNGEYPFFTCAAEPLRSAGYSFDGESILLPGNGANVGLALYYNGKFEAYQRTYVLNNFSADVKYVFFHLKERWKKSQENKQFGSATNYIRYDNIASYKIPLPPLPIQKQIAEILEKADQAKQKRKEANKLTDEFLQSVFIEMFGDPVQNPKGWEKKKFGEIFSSIRYGTGSPPEYKENGIPFIRATNIKNNSIVKKDLVFISREDANKIKKCELREGNLIVVRSGVNTGDAAVIPKEFDGSYAAYDLIVELELVHSIFYSFLINSNYGKAIIEPLSRRAGQPHLNAEQLKEIEFYFPPLSLQQQFAEIVNKTEALKEKQKQSEQELENLFQSSMQKAFKGELV